MAHDGRAALHVQPVVPAGPGLLQRRLRGVQALPAGPVAPRGQGAGGRAVGAQVPPPRLLRARPPPRLPRRGLPLGPPRHGERRGLGVQAPPGDGQVLLRAQLCPHGVSHGGRGRALRRHSPQRPPRGPPGQGRDARRLPRPRGGPHRRGAGRVEALRRGAGRGRARGLHRAGPRLPAEQAQGRPQGQGPRHQPLRRARLRSHHGGH
mmetsp:Transcript_11920/g.40317  ORF Transcript_11920/g.40317 Transcript_11920/m.40317 type:complete len:207 (+) Transcript_11920:429-1049(+)